MRKANRRCWRESRRVSCSAYVLETGHIVMEGYSKELANDPRIKEGYLDELTPGYENASFLINRRPTQAGR